MEKIHIFEDAKFRYGKIKVNNEKIIDLNDFLFYFKPKQYKKLRLVFEENLEKPLEKKVIKLYSYF